MEIIPGVDSDLKDLAHSWTLTSFKEDHMDIQIMFKKPLKVSSNPARDKLKIEFLNTFYFRDKETNLQLDSDHVLISKEIPR